MLVLSGVYVKSKIVKNIVLLTLIIVISIAGFSSYSFLASRNVQRDLRGLLEPKIKNTTPLAKAIQDAPKGPIVIPADWPIISIWNPEGVFNRYSDQDSYRDVAIRSIEIAFGHRPELLNWGVRYPFLIPIAIHIFIVGITSFGFGAFLLKTVSVRSTQSFLQHVLISALYAYAITICFQGGRMLWGSGAWGGRYFGRIFNPIGPFALYLFFGLCIAIYLYCIFATAGFHVRRHPKAKKQTCIKCHYNLQRLTGNCPECDLEIGAYIPSKIRINHWYLAAMFIITFFSPVMVASVYSIFG